MKMLEDKTIVLTGASSGIGLALAERLSRLPLRLAVLGRRIGLLEDLARRMADRPAKILPVECDVARRAAIADAMKSVRQAFGEVDVAVLNAGIDKFSPVERYSSADAEQVFSVNLFGVIYMLEQLVPSFIERRAGTILAVSSMADSRGLPGNAFYSASKRALSHYLESLRVELRPYRIGVQIVRPGFVRTAMTASNAFSMPMALTVEQAAARIEGALRSGRRRTSFPALAAFAMKLMRMVPAPIYESIAYRTYAKTSPDAGKGLPAD